PSARCDPPPRRALPTRRSSDLEFAGVSRDGKFAAVSRSDSPSQSDIWLVDLERSISTRFIIDPARADFAIWSPDGSRIAFQSNRDRKSTRLNSSHVSISYPVFC